MHSESSSGRLTDYTSLRNQQCQVIQSLLAQLLQGNALELDTQNWCMVLDGSTLRSRLGVEVCLVGVGKVSTVRDGDVFERWESQFGERGLKADERLALVRFETSASVLTR